MPRGDAEDIGTGRTDRTQSGVGSDDAARQAEHAPSGTSDTSGDRDVGAGTAPEDPTKTKVVASPDARNDRAHRDGTRLEGPHRPSSAPLGGDRRNARESGDEKAEEVERRAIGRAAMPMVVLTRSDVGGTHCKTIQMDEGAVAVSRRPRRSRRKVKRGRTRTFWSRGTCPG